MCRNHSHATVLKRGQVVITAVGWLTAYSLVGEMKLELPTGEHVTLPPSTIFFVPCPGWEGLLMWDIPQTEELITAERFSMEGDAMSQPTTPMIMNAG
jgi:hypothetical protein